MFKLQVFLDLLHISTVIKKLSLTHKDRRHLQAPVNQVIYSPGYSVGHCKWIMGLPFQSVKKSYEIRKANINADLHFRNSQLAFTLA